MIKARKSLGLSCGVHSGRTKWGQNFLRDKGILKKIADFAQIKKKDIVVEVGSGKGTLTKFLLERADRIIAIEKDEKFVKELKEKSKEERNGRLEIIQGDALEIENLLKVAKLKIKNYVLVGNIPYYITGALFKKFLESENQPKSITFVVQKEVADRIMAGDSKESMLSISVKAYGKPELGGIIKAGSFHPRPKVDSAIIAVRNINKNRFKNISEEKFFQILKKGFAHKRKLLIKNLGISKEIFKKCDVPEKARAENLSVDNWICLAKNLL